MAAREVSKIAELRLCELIGEAGDIQYRNGEKYAKVSDVMRMLTEKCWCRSKRADFVVKSVTSLLGNQHVASQMCVNVHNDLCQFKVKPVRDCSDKSPHSIGGITCVRDLCQNAVGRSLLPRVYRK